MCRYVKASYFLRMLLIILKHRSRSGKRGNRLLALWKVDLICQRQLHPGLTPCFIALIQSYSLDVCK